MQLPRLPHLSSVTLPISFHQLYHAVFFQSLLPEIALKHSFV